MNIIEIQDRIIVEFSTREDWIDKYEYLIDLGKELDPLPAALKTEENAIRGCQARVWISAGLEDGKLDFYADSDAQITRGLIALLLRVLNHQTPGDIVNSDLYFIEKIGLSSHLSPSRANGLASIVKHMKWHAAKYLTIAENIRH